MAGIALDEGVSKLAEFVQRLAQASGVLGELASSLEGAARGLEGAQQSGEEALGSLAREVEESTEALANDVEGAHDALDALAETADDAAHGTLADVRDLVESTADALGQRVAEGQAALEEGFARLVESGFDAQGAAVESALHQADTLDTLQAGAATELVQVAAEGGQRLEAGSGGVLSGLEGVATAAGDEGAEVEESFRSGSSSWHEAIDGGLTSGCEEAGQAIASAYAEWTEQVETVVEALVEQVDEALEAVTRSIGFDELGLLEGALRHGLTEPAAVLKEALAESDAGLEQAQAVSGEVAALAPDLRRSLAVVAEVDRLLNAVAGA